MAKKRSKKRGSKKAGSKRTTRRASRSAAGISTSELIAELKKRERELHRLMARREKLAGDLAALDREISQLESIVGGGRGGSGARVAGGRRRRSRGGETLETALAGVLKGKTMGVSEAADAVLATGYQTSAANFRTMVNQTLLKSDMFKKVARGQYTAA